MKFKLLTLISFISSAVFSQSGSIEGRIIFEDNAGLSATVTLQELQENTIIDKENSFTFKNIEEGVYTLMVTSLGYTSLSQQIKVTANQTETFTIRLSPENMQLEEVVIIDRQTGLNSKTPYNFTAVRMDRIDSKSSPAGVMGVLREVPGVYGAEFGQGIVKPFIRGLGFSRVATIYQGNKLENQQWGADHGLGVNDLGIESIDVIKGPASVLYGSGALGGVILLKEDEFYKDSKTLSGNVGSTFNSVSNGFRSYASVGKRFESDLFFGTDLAYENHADYKSGDGDIIGNSRFNMSTARFHIGVDKEKFDNKLSVTYNKQNLGIIGDDELINSNATTRNDRDMQLPFQEVTDVGVL